MLKSTIDQIQPKFKHIHTDILIDIFFAADLNLEKGKDQEKEKGPALEVAERGHVRLRVRKENEANREVKEAGRGAKGADREVEIEIANVTKKIRKTAVEIERKMLKIGLHQDRKFREITMRKRKVSIPKKINVTLKIQIIRPKKNLQKNQTTWIFLILREFETHLGITLINMF